MEIDIGCFTETWLDDKISDEEVAIPGYEIIRRDRNRRGGGVAVYIKEMFVYEKVIYLYQQDIENVWVKIQLPKQSDILINCIYRPPDATAEYFNVFVNNITSAEILNLPIIILGDFNIDYSDPDSNLGNRLQIFEDIYQFKQLITNPTRETINSSTIIDHIFTNTIHKHSASGIVKTTLSDHYMIYTIFKATKQPKQERIIQLRNYKNFNESLFIHDLIKAYSLHLSHIENITSVTELWDLWKIIFLSISNKHAPVRYVKMKNRNNPWITRDIINLIYTRDKIYQKACNTKDPQTFNLYRKIRNKITQQIKQEERKYYMHRINTNKNNPKQLWKSISHALGNNKHQTKPTHISADKFNTFFATVGEELAKTFSNRTTEPPWPFPKCLYNFSFSHIQEQFVSHKLKLLGKEHSSLDILGFDSKLLCIAAEIITPSLTALLNLSLTTGIVPPDWKLSRITPIFKGSGATTNESNYRPISVIAHIAKILETNVHKQLISYLHEYKLITNNQSAFLKKHSTQTALHDMTDDWLIELDDKSSSGVCFIDFKKCFDTIDYPILLFKLTKYGINNTEHKWFQSFLAGRKQQVRQNNKLSSQLNTTIGVPQGSALGPLLFLLYINDLPTAVTSSSIHLFADDTTIYFSHSDPEIIQRSLQHDIDKVNNWFKANKLTINTNKTKSMLINHNHNPLSINLSINNENIKQASSHKLLGLYIDQNLKWDVHIAALRKKLSPKLGLLSRLRHKLPQEAMLQLYFPLIQSHIDYGLTCWGHCNQTFLNQLQTIQNRAIHYITSDFTSSSSTLLAQHSILNIDQRKTYLTNVLTYKSLNNLTPHYLSDKFTRFQDIRSYSTSNNNRMVLPRARTNYSRNTFAFNGARSWNNLPNSIISVKSLALFKKMTKEHILN